MKLALQDVDFADGDDLAVIRALAVADDQLDKAFHPNVSYEDGVAASKARWLSLYGFQPFYHQKVVDLDTGKTVAFSRWMVEEPQFPFLPPRTGIPEGTEIPARQRPATLDLNFAMQFGQLSGAIEEKCIQERPAISQDAMCVLPEYRDTEAAELMLKWLEGFADKHNLVCFVSVIQHDLPRYSKAGFKYVDTLKVPFKDSVITREAMLREPSKSSA